MFTRNPAPGILIIRPDRIGDVVLSTGIPREIKKAYPGARVGVLVRDYTSELFLYNPNVDYMLSKDELLPDGKLTLNSIKKIRQFRFDISLTLLPEEKLNYLLFFSGIRLRIGVGHKFYQFITNVKSVYRRKYIPMRHEADFCIDTLRKLGIQNPDFTPEIFLSEPQKVELIKKKEKIAGNKPIIGVHITSGGSAPNWQSENYYELINKLLSDGRFCVMITDNELPENFPFGSEVLTPNVGISLSESLVNFAMADILVSASTGPMHICGGLGVDTISLFCPLPACTPELWGALGNKPENILPSAGYCQTKCPGDPKICDLSGEGGIAPTQVYNKILEKTFKI